MSIIGCIEKLEEKPEGMQLLEVVVDKEGFVNIGITGKLEHWSPNLIEYVSDSLTSYADYMRSTLGKAKQ